MQEFKPMRDLPSLAEWTSQDVMVVFGELFQRGYANGIVDQAKSKGMKVIYATVGRRDEQLKLRPLTASEILEKDSPLINIPLEAGFDLEPCSQNGVTPVDQLKGVKMSEWNQVELDWSAIESSRLSGIECFRQRVANYLEQLEEHIPPEANILFVHTMAGGFPRAKVVMPITNKVFKGYDERYASSEEFWQSDMGKLCALSFREVTAETLYHLLDLTARLRASKKDQGKKVAYVAYGYHGTEVLLNNHYRWQSYSPYLQGWAKLRLEEIAKEAFANNISCSVFNCPEILTNSSSIFLGVEVSLYPLLGALKKEASSQAQTQKVLQECASLLSEGHSLEEIVGYCNDYLTSSTIQQWSNFAAWPQHNGNEQMKLMRESSANLIDMHKDPKDLITYRLSEVVIRACGQLMFQEAWRAREPVWWLGHDVIAKTYN